MLIVVPISHCRYCWRFYRKSHIESTFAIKMYWNTKLCNGTGRFHIFYTSCAAINISCRVTSIAFISAPVFLLHMGRHMFTCTSFVSIIIRYLKGYAFRRWCQNESVSSQPIIMSITIFREYQSIINLRLASLCHVCQSKPFLYKASPAFISYWCNN